MMRDGVLMDRHNTLIGSELDAIIDQFLNFFDRVATRSIRGRFEEPLR